MIIFRYNLFRKVCKLRLWASWMVRS